MYVCARLYFSAASTYLQLASYYAYAHEKYSVPKKKSNPKGNLYYLKKEETISGIPEAETFGRNRKFSAFGFRFRLPKLKAEYGRNSRKALSSFIPSVFQDEKIMAWFLNPFLAVNFY